METFDFTPRRAIVTASDSGIGQAIAIALADLDVGRSVDGGMLHMGPQAGSDLTSDDRRKG
ncbi:hypothetical protein [Microbacterium sp. E-13]|uniref:hypothetical protein n=1 Tax=Microbacterium sp. E-13 TaxID=3404048 RepID=UPI003CEBB266